MSLQTGNLEDLVNHGVVERLFIAKMAYRDILKRLDYLHNKGYIHRDLKPANVLYTHRNGRLAFCIADLGLHNLVSTAQTYCGTVSFMPPEIYYRQSGQQTPAVDMWSLLMIIAWVLDLGRHRSQQCKKYPDMLRAVLGDLADWWQSMKGLQALANLDHRKRATAAQMLLHHCKGQGLTTPLEDVPALQPVDKPLVGDIQDDGFVLQPQAVPILQPVDIPRVDDIQADAVVATPQAVPTPAPVTEGPTAPAAAAAALGMPRPRRGGLLKKLIGPPPRVAPGGRRAPPPKRKSLWGSSAGAGRRRAENTDAPPAQELMMGRHFGSGVARETRVAKNPATPQPKPATTCEREVDGGPERRRSAVSARRLPTAGPKADCLAELLRKLPGAFPI